MYRNLIVLAAGCLICFFVFLLTFTGDARPRADFIWNNSTEPETLDPLRMSGEPEFNVAAGLFEGLTTYHPATLQPVPAVAKSWQLEGLTYTFRLRQDAWWVKGKEIFQTQAGLRNVTAHDFVYTWRAHAFPENGSEYAYLFHIISGYEEYQKAVEAQWREIVGRYGPGKQRPARNIVTTADLVEEDQQEVLRLREDLWSETVGIQTPDDFTLRVNLRAAAPYFTILTSFHTYLAVPREPLEEHGNEWVLPENIVTNGPYYLETWRFNAFIRLRKNRHYWETPEYAERRLQELAALPASPERTRERDLLTELGAFGTRGLEILEALAIEEQNTALNLYINGDIDRVRELPSNIVGEIIAASEQPPGVPHLRHAPQMVVYFYNLNLELPVFQGVAGRKLRRAMALTIDRVGLVETVTREGQKPAYAFVPPGVPDYPVRKLFGSGDFDKDVQEARRLIQEVVAEKGKLPRLRILYNTSENHARIAAFIQAGWREHLGLRCDLTNQEWGVFLESRRTGNFDVARMGWIGDYPDANTFLDLYTSTNPNNDPKYKNLFYDRIVLEYAAHVDDMIRDPARRQVMLDDLKEHPLFDASENGQATRLAEALSSFDAAPSRDKPHAAFVVRRVLLEFAEEILMYDLPVIPIYFYVRAQLWPPGLEGIHTNLIDHHPVRFLRWRGDQRVSGSRYDDFPRLR